MSTVLLKPAAKQLYSVEPQQSHPKLSLRRVLWVKVLRWTDGASPQAIWKVIRAGSMSLAFSFFFFLPEESLDLSLQLLTFDSGKIPLFCLGLLCLLKAKRMWLWLKRRAVRQRGENQFTFEGVPVGEFASFLKTHESFKLADATKELGIGPKQWTRMSAEMKKRGLLVHGENNAQMLRPIGMQNLVRQLRDNDLVWTGDAQCFVEKVGGFARWHLDREFEQKKLEEQTVKKERKLERIEKQIEAAQEHPLFAQLA